MALSQATLKSAILALTSDPENFPETPVEVSTRWAAIFRGYFATAVMPVGGAAAALVAEPLAAAAMITPLASASPIAGLIALDAALTAFAASIVLTTTAPPATVVTPPPLPPTMSVWLAPQTAAIAAGNPVSADTAAEHLTSTVDTWFKTGISVTGGVPSQCG